jgi:sugar/nucleoside kinase (ribokinase family)
LTLVPPSPARQVINSTGTGDVLSMCMILLHARPDFSVRQKLARSNRVVAEYIEGRRTMIPTI